VVPLADLNLNTPRYPIQHFQRYPKIIQDPTFPECPNPWCLDVFGVLNHGYGFPRCGDRITEADVSWQMGGFQQFFSWEKYGKTWVRGFQLDQF